MAIGDKSYHAKLLQRSFLNWKLFITFVRKQLAMDIEIDKIGTGSYPIDRRVIGYVVAVISEFAKAYNMTIREASNYLNRYKGLEFLTEHYESEHLLSIDDSVQDLARVCYNNGGGVLTHLSISFTHSKR